MLAAANALLASLASAVTNESLATMAPPATPAPAALDAGGDLMMMVLRMSGALAAVLALVVGLAWAAKRYLPASALRASAGSRIDVIATRTLGMRRSLVLARVHGRVLLLGATPQQIQCLSEWEEGSDWPANEPAAAATPDPHSSAMERFQALREPR
ncbi:MAG: flagellar biosynthetic protein FliO [Candidatus Sumerlaeota bacterium]|nr:flagellar biosynthetic protein FliO [Candidatus Sumerlaeota bacterium]